MKKKISLFTSLLLLMVLAVGTLAQTPQYYNGTTGGNNTYPFGQPPGQRVHWLIRPGTLNLPTPCPGGNVDTIYFYMFTTGSATFTQLTIKAKSLAITTLPTAWYTTQLDTVYYRASVTLSCTANSWMAIPLDHPIAYDTSKGLVIDVQQCGATTGTMWVTQMSGTPATRNYGIPSGCPVGYIGQDGQIIDFGVHVSAGVQWYKPDLIYYKFENNPSPTSVLNFACPPGVGTSPAPIIGHTLGSGGQFDSCLIGSGGSANYINTGWATNLGNNSWTISMWLANLPTQGQLGISPCYLFGDPGAGSFRAFWAGAGTGTNDTAILVRHTGSPDLRVPLLNAPANTYVVHIVYNSTNSSLRAYRNGVFAVQTTWASPNITGAGPFRVAGYNATSALFNNARMDEFRLYSRALSDSEVAATWNIEVTSCPVGINPLSNGIPTKYNLSQNYPNPFNPATKISYELPKAGLVKLVVYDILGREVKTLVNEFKQAGGYSLEFDASKYASGVYFYTLRSGDFTDTKKMVLIK